MTCQAHIKLGMLRKGQDLGAFDQAAGLIHGESAARMRWLRPSAQTA